MGTLTKDASTGVSIQDHLRFQGLADVEEGLQVEPQKVFLGFQLVQGHFFGRSFKNEMIWRIQLIVYICISRSLIVLFESETLQNCFIKTVLIYAFWKYLQELTPALILNNKVIIYFAQL